MIDGARGFSSRAGGFVCAALLTLGCAASPEPYRARYGEIGSGAMAGYRGDRALIVEFQPGDRLPVDLRFEGEDFVLSQRLSFGRDDERRVAGRAHPQGSRSDMTSSSQLLASRYRTALFAGV